jgi:hypothetical protein
LKKHNVAPSEFILMSESAIHDTAAQLRQHLGIRQPGVEFEEESDD